MSKLGEEIRDAYAEKEWSGTVMLDWAFDVDALMAVVKALQEDEPPIVTVPNTIAALAALPEHLKNG